MSRLVHMGIDDRAAFKGARRNDFTSNINAISLDDRLEDEHYYRNMPMTGPATDPVNMHGDDDKKQSLRNALLARIQDIVPPPVVPNVEPVVINSQPTADSQPTAAPATLVGTAMGSSPREQSVTGPMDVLRRTAASWHGLYKDTCAWERLPAPDAGHKLRYVLTRNHRFPYILAMVVLIVFFIILGHVLW